MCSLRSDPPGAVQGREPRCSCISITSQGHFLEVFLFFLLNTTTIFWLPDTPFSGFPASKSRLLFLLLEAVSASETTWREDRRTKRDFSHALGSTVHLALREGFSLCGFGWLPGKPVPWDSLGEKRRNKPTVKTIQGLSFTLPNA